MSGSLPDSLIPPDEERRIRALHDLGVLDTRRERRFDALVEDLAQKLDAPIAYLALIAEERQWLKSKVGPIPTDARREDAFCSRTILGHEPLLVADAAEDPRFSGSPLVRDAPHLRFYAGVPIQSTGGYTVGTVCVAGPTPRQIRPRDVAILRGFAERLQSELNTQPEVLLLYAKEDEELVGRFIATDPRLEDPAVLDFWSSRRAEQTDGNDWRLKDALWRARSAALMVSPAFLRSSFVRDKALELLLQTRELDEFRTTLVLLRPCDRGEVAWLAGRASWPTSGVAVADGSEAEVGRHFRDLAVELIGAPPDGAEPSARIEERARERVFLSHAGEDSVAVQDLAGRLRQAGLDVWLDVDELEPGDDWMQALEDALHQSDAFAVYIGRSGIARWIGREVRLALDRNARDPRFRFIPILGPGSDPEALPSFVAQHHWLDLREGDPQPEEIRKLVAAILRRPPEALSLLPAGEPPFRGLLTFGVEHSHLFFGRDRETADLLEKLQTSPFLAVIGDSGSGKSSLVRAGLVPALHRGHFRDAAARSTIWRVAVIKPGSDPFRELARGLLGFLPELGAAERSATLEACREQLAEGTQGLCTALSALVPKGDRTLLVIDQFEEVFTQCPDPDERDRFIDSLLEASRCDGDRPHHTVVTLRADFYSRCFEHPTLPKVLSTSQYAVRAIPPHQLAEVIQKPAMLAGIRLEPGLVEAILFDLGEGPGHLPLLEHTLLQLWKLRTSETLTHDAYERIGRVQGALEHHAEEVYAKFDAEQKLAARRLMLALVLPTETAGPARRRAKIAGVLPVGDGRAAAEAVLGRLVDERLLMVRGASGGLEAPVEGAVDRGPDESEVEVTHEALLRGWRRLGGWLEEDREFLFWRQRTGAAFEAWKESGRDAGALMRGAPLAEACRWLESRAEDLSEDGRTFIEASIALARRQKRIWRVVMATIAAVGAVAVVAAWLAVGAKNEAESSLEIATSGVDEALTRVGSVELKNVPQLEEVRAKLLERAEDLSRRLGAQRPSASGLQLQAALAPARIAEIHSQMDQKEKARSEFETAIERLDELIRRDPDELRYRRERAKVQTALGWLITDAGGRVGPIDDAAAHLDRAIEFQQTLLEDDPDDPEVAAELSESHLNRGILRSKQGKLEAADTDYSAAIRHVQPFEGQTGERSAVARQQLARSHNQLASLFGEKRKRAEATREYEAAVGLFESLLAEFPDSRKYKEELAKAYRNLASSQKQTEPLEAEEHSRKAVELNDQLARALPAIRSEQANALTTQGRVLESRDRELASEKYREASRIFTELLEDPKNWNVSNWDSQAVTLLYLADLRADAGDTDELASVWRRLQEALSHLSEPRRAEIEGHRKFQKVRERVRASEISRSD